MARKYVDCRQHLSATNCTVAFYAAREEELMEVAVQHALAAHGHQDTPELRQSIKSLIKEEAPAAD